MAYTEEYFPRGGKKPTLKFTKQSSNFLGAPEKGERKRKPKKKSEDDDGYLSDEEAKQIDQSYKNCGIWLNYKTVKEGFLMLARVRQVSDTKLEVSLPCRLYGTVMACHISEAYNKQLEAYVNDQTDKVRELWKMFRVGQYVAVRVLEQSASRLMLSVMPQHVNGGRTVADLHKGALIQAAVWSVEDHGFMMETGIPNVRAFLPKDAVNPDIELDTGVLTWCCVKSTTESGVVTLSNELTALQRAVQRKPTAVLPPATAVEFTVDKPLENGIEGHILGDTAAYIQRHHANAAKSKKPTLGQKIRARVLYVIPTSKTPFLTMKGVFDATVPDMEEEQKYQDGDIIDNAQVIKITGRTVHLKLGGRSAGVLSLRRIQVDEELSDERVVANSYPIGSTHKVRVLTYHLTDGVYSVSDEAATLRERYFTLRDLTVADTVVGVVKTVADTHLYVQVGKVVGYVPKLHLSDSGLFIDPKKVSTSKLPRKKYKEGQEVKARVLSVDLAHHKLTLTLKRSLLAPDVEPLTSYEQAQVGKAYTGVIGVVKDFIMVSFFGGVVAYVARQYVMREPIEHLADAFHVGQIVNCTILRVNLETRKITGSLTTQPFIDDGRNKKNRKRKLNAEEQIDAENKKPKPDEEQNKDNKAKKKKRNINTQEDLNASTDAEESDKLKKKDKKKNLEGKRNQESVEESDIDQKMGTDESDAIETDIYDENDVMTPQELGLIDLSDCVTLKNYKRRVTSLIKAINARDLRLITVHNKINNIEAKGLNARNKKFHTAMHTEMSVIEQRINKLTEALKIAQEKLKEFNWEPNNDYKRKKEKKVSESDVDEELNENVSQIKNKKKVSVSDLHVELKRDVSQDKNKNKKKVSESDADVESNGNKLQKKKHRLSESDVDVELKENLVQDKKKMKKKVSESDADQELKENKKNKKSEGKKKVLSLEVLLEVPSVKDFYTNSESLVLNQEEQESSSSEDEVQEKPKKKRKKLTAAEKVAKAREEEERVRALERQAAGSEGEPRSSDQFERALLANPDCSQLWIAYMAFHLQATEIERARAVARRAVSSISFREEAERLNVWLALLGLEHRFGTQETQQKVLEEAVQRNEPYRVHSALLTVLLDTSKPHELAALVDLMLRKYKRQVDMYGACGDACYRAGLVDKARHVMQKGIAVLDKKDHVSLLVKFAQLERTAGYRERAEALFEQVLAVYPQRVDVCSAYLDMLAKAGDADHVRQVMERMTSQKLPARKMKVLYKKWVDVEERMGDKQQADAIRQRAMDYIEQAKF